MSHHPRWIPTPGASRKRKEREESFYGHKPPAFTTTTTTKAASTALPVCSNRLLAGYMAYEFLTKGTLFGHKYDPARAGAVPLSGASAESRRMKPEAESSPKEEHQGYAEVANILKSNEAHIPAIVNPAQLARWIRM